MSDISEIRKRAIEVMARTEWRDNHRGEIASMGWTWENVASGMRFAYRRSAQRMVDALAEAGLLPVDEESTRVYDLTGGDDYDVVRYVCGWRREADE